MQSVANGQQKMVGGKINEKTNIEQKKKYEIRKKWKNGKNK